MCKRVEIIVFDLFWDFSLCDGDFCYDVLFNEFLKDVLLLFVIINRVIVFYMIGFYGFIYYWRYFVEFVKFFFDCFRSDI